MVVDKDDNVILNLTGYSMRCDTTQLGSASTILKLDSSGALIWHRGFRQEENWGSAVAVDALGNVYCSGTFEDSIRIATAVVSSSHTTTIKGFVARLTPSGAVSWLRKIESPTQPAGFSRQIITFLQVDSLGNSYTGGSGEGRISVGPFVANYNWEFPYMVKLDSAGTPVFLKALRAGRPQNSTSPRTCRFTAAKLDESGRLYLSGVITDTVYFTPTEVVRYPPFYSSCSPYVGAMDTGGNFLWNRYSLAVVAPEWSTYIFSGAGRAYAMAKILPAFPMNAQSLPVSGNGSDGQLLVFNDTGTVICLVQDSALQKGGCTTPGAYYTIGVKPDTVVGSVANFYRVAHTIKIMKWRDDTCSTSLWTKRVEGLRMEGIGVRDVNALSSSPLFHPNPSADGVFASSPLIRLDRGRLQVWDAMGSVVAARVYADRLDLSHLPRGMYFYRLTSDGEERRGRIFYR